VNDFEDDDVAVQCLMDVAAYFGWKCVRVNDLEDDTLMVGFVLGETDFCASVISTDKNREDMI